MPEYAIILLLFLIAAYSAHKISKVKIFRSKNQIIVLFLILYPLFVAWDNFAIYRGHWSFGERFLLGPKIGFIPIEEYAFVAIVSYFGLVLYKITEKYFSK